jgi:hypothetical protein
VGELFGEFVGCHLVSTLSSIRLLAISCQFTSEI